MDRVLIALGLVGCGSVLAACAGAPPPVDPAVARWHEFVTGSTASLRGLAPVSRRVCWVGGSGGTLLRTVDGGRTWQRLPVAGGEELDFRDVHAWSAAEAVVLNAGAPARIFRTVDGGASFQVVHRDDRAGIFLDGLCMVGDVGFVFGDPLEGGFVVLRSLDRGRRWASLPAAALPAPEPGEAGFAASGSNLCAVGRDLWIATGGGRARLLRSRDLGASFTVHDLPVIQGEPSQGAFAVAFADARRGVVVGGDYRRPGGNDRTAAWTDDGGATWFTSRTGALGYRSGVTWLPGADAFVAVGEAGASWSADGGRSWQALPGPGFHAVAVAADGTVWAAGGGGRVARLEPR